MDNVLEQMTREGIWADQKFIQCSAWFLEMNIGLFDVAGNSANPYYIIDCEKENAESLWIGLKTDVHYHKRCSLELTRICSHW